MGLIRTIFWFAVFVVSTFAFTVIFEHGFGNFQANAEKEWQNLQKLYGAKVERKKDQSDSLGR